MIADCFASLLLLAFIEWYDWLLTLVTCTQLWPWPICWCGGGEWCWVILYLMVIDVLLLLTLWRRLCCCFRWLICKQLLLLLSVREFVPPVGPVCVHAWGDWYDLVFVSFFIRFSTALQCLFVCWGNFYGVFRVHNQSVMFIYILYIGPFIHIHIHMSMSSLHYKQNTQHILPTVVYVYTL